MCQQNKFYVPDIQFLLQKFVLYPQMSFELVLCHEDRFLCHKSKIRADRTNFISSILVSFLQNLFWTHKIDIVSFELVLRQQNRFCLIVINFLVTRISCVNQFCIFKNRFFMSFLLIKNNISVPLFVSMLFWHGFMVWNPI